MIYNPRGEDIFNQQNELAKWKATQSKKRELDMRFRGPAGLRWSNEQWIGFSFSYDNDGPAVTEALKQFPIKAWDPTNKTWWMPASLSGLLMATVRAWFPEITMPVIPTRTEVRRAPQVDDHFVLGLHPDAPNCVVHAAYRALARELDPHLSVGGLSVQQLKDVTEAYQRLCRVRAIEPVKLSVT